jgi:hypothetical protein
VGLLKSDRLRLTIAGVIFARLGAGSFRAMLASGMINPWQVLHVKKGEQGASGL